MYFKVVMETGNQVKICELGRLGYITHGTIEINYYYMCSSVSSPMQSTQFRRSPAQDQCATLKCIGQTVRPIGKSSVPPLQSEHDGDPKP